MNITLGTKNRGRRGRAVERAAVAYAEVAAEAMARRMTAAGYPAPGSAPIAGAVRRAGELLQLERERLEAADAACQRVRTQRRELGRDRDRATRAIYREVGRVRRTVTALVGAERAREYLDGGDTVRAPHHLLIQAGHVVHLLADSPQPLRVRGDAGVSVEGAELVGRLRALIAESEQALWAVAVARRREDAALSAKRRATASFDLRGKQLAHRLETLLDAGGLYSLADAVRPWTGRRGRPPKDQRLDLHPDLVARVTPPSAAEDAPPAAIEEPRDAKPAAPAAILERSGARQAIEPPQVDHVALRNAEGSAKAGSPGRRTAAHTALRRPAKIERRRRGSPAVGKESEEERHGSPAGLEINRKPPARPPCAAAKTAEPLRGSRPSAGIRPIASRRRCTGIHTPVIADSRPSTGVQ